MLKFLYVIALYKYYVVKVQIAISLKKICSVWIKQNPHIQPYKTQILHTTDQVSVSPYICIHFCVKAIVNNYVSNFVCI